MGPTWQQITSPRSLSRRQLFTPRLPENVWVLVLYCCLSVLVFGWGVLADPRHVVEGSGQGRAFYGHDQGNFVWFIAWTEHAITHLANPFPATNVYAPHGYDLAWATSILGPAALLAPLTAAAGPVASFNLLALAAPVTTAFATYLLCRQFTGRSASLAGGLIFGFGTFESGEMINHVHLALSALVPLSALLVVKRARARLTRTRFIVLLGLVLALQLWTATEQFASLGLFGGLAFGIAWATGAPGGRRAVAGVAAESAAAVAVAVVLAAPVLYYALRYPNPLDGYPASIDAGADLANFVLPTQLTWLHGHVPHFKLNITEQLAYFGLPLIALLGITVATSHRAALPRFLAAFMLFPALASLGGHLVIHGDATGIPLPWAAIGRLPLLGHAIPARFIAYTWLAAAVAVAYWLDHGDRRPARWLLFALVAITLAPNLTGLPWASRVDRPPLMTGGSLGRIVPRGSIVLALPYGIDGDSMEWQAESGFEFRLAGGYISWAAPSGYREVSFVRVLAGRRARPRAARALCSFISRTGTTVVLAREHGPRTWNTLRAALHVAPIRTGGFLVFDLGRADDSHGSCRV